MRMPQSPLVYYLSLVVPALKKVVSIVVVAQFFLIDFHKHGANWLAFIFVAYSDDFVYFV